MAPVVTDLIYSYRCSGLAAGQPFNAKTGFSVPHVTPANLAATNTAVASLATALNALTLGVVGQDALNLAVALSAALPGATANRSEKWIISAQESTGDFNKFTYTIPAGNPALAVTGTVNYDPSNAAWVAFASAFSAICVSPAGNPLSFLGAKLGGRRR